jgi:hypothetical protein
MSEELKPCQCSGKASWHEVDFGGGSRQHWIECNDCGLRTGGENYEHEALRVWNTRAKPGYKYTTFENFGDSTGWSVRSIGENARAAFNAAREGV